MVGEEFIPYLLIAGGGALVGGILFLPLIIVGSFVGASAVSLLPLFFLAGAVAFGPAVIGIIGPAVMELIRPLLSGGGGSK